MLLNIKSLFDELLFTVVFEISTVHACAGAHSVRSVLFADILLSLVEGVQIFLLHGRWIRIARVKIVKHLLIGHLVLALGLRRCDCLLGLTAVLAKSLLLRTDNDIT